VTDTSVRQSAASSSSLQMVTADQVSILGNGTPAFPLRAGTGGGSFLATFSGFGFHPGVAVLGMPVFVIPAPPAVGIATVRQASAGAGDFNQVVGFVSSVAPDPLAPTIQTSGKLALSTSQWDVITGGSGGLIPGATYYLSVIFGQITVTAPSVPTTFRVQVGVAIDSETLLLSTPSVPVEN